MENQPNQPLPAGRQWFRLASLARREALGQGTSQGPANATPGTAAPALAPGPAAPAPASRPTQAAASRIPLARLGSFTLQPQLPQQPPPQTQQVQQEPKAQNKPPLVAAESQRPPTPEVSKSPTPPSPTSRNPSRAPTSPPPPESPKVIKQSSPTPPESPTIRKLKPIKAPPPYPEPEPKPQTAPNPTNKFTQQENSNGSVKAIADVNGKPPANGNHSHTDTRALPPLDKRETTNNGVGMTTALKKKDDYREVKVISMAGENMGAYMQLGSSPHVNRKLLHGYSLQNQTKGNESHNEEVMSEQKKKDKGKSSTAEGKPMVALVNSNVQSVNNSILFRSSCSEKSPGVRMTIVRGQRQPKLKSTHHQ